MKLLDQKTALITGGSRGIGEAIALRFAAEGANIAFSYLPPDDNAVQVIKKLEAFSVKVKSYESDASSYLASEELIRSVLEDFGSIDIVVNNAGITRDNLMLRMDENQWDKVIQVNLKSVFNITKSVTPALLKQRSGVIINMSSLVGQTGNAGQANYAASKAGVIGFTKSIAKEFASRNIRCNAIAPGFIETDMTKDLDPNVKAQYMANIPLKRYGNPGEIADVALFLASDLSSYVTGQVISVCGGLHV